MYVKIYSRFFVALVLAFSIFTTAKAQIAPKTLQDIQLLMQEKASRTPAQKKMDSHLLQASREKHGQKMVEGVNLEPANVNAERDGRVKVDINAEVSDELINKIIATGGEIIYPSKEYHSVRALINLSSAETIAGFKEVKFIQPAVLSMTLGSGDPGKLKKNGVKLPVIASPSNGMKGLTVAKPTLVQRKNRVREALKKYLREHDEYNPSILNSGSVNSQGDPSHRADETRSKYGYAGQGIKIGVLSDSYNRLGGAPADVLNDDLPGTGNPFGNTTPVTVVVDYTPSGNDEGRAMLQIVHDLAPKAQLFFATANLSEASFASNIVALRNTYGCDIIIDDVAYFDEPAFQDGIVAQAVNTVTAAGALYFSSAGNSGSVALGTSGVWEGDFNDVGSPVFTGGSKTGTIHNFGSTPANGDSILAVGSGAYYLQWADPYGASTNDYDLFLVSSAGAVKASSTTVQNGTQNPYEAFSPPALVAGDRFVVFKAASAAVRAIHLNSSRGRLKVGTTGQTHGHACAAEAYCVAAVPATGVPFVSTNTVETFSSDGLRRIFFNPDGTPITPGNLLFSTNGGTVRNKPDITAADGVVTTLPASTGLNPFFGTSAAAPHAGAIAALLKSANPLITSARIRTILDSTALDIQTPGYDNVSGFGILQTMQAMQAVNPIPLPYINIGTNTVTEGSYSNGNGSVDPGELGNLVVQLNNLSLANASGVSATVTTTTSGVTILQGSSNYGTINSSTSSANTLTPFKFAVNSSVACGTVITFQIKITFTGGVGTLGYNVTTTLGQKTIGLISSTLGVTPPAGSGYTVTSGQQTGRLSRGTVASTCAAPVANPGLVAETSPVSPRQYDAYVFTNTTAASQCYTVTMSSPNGVNLYTAAYNSSGFVPSNPSLNYIAEPGQSATTQTYSFTVSSGAAFTVVVHDVNTGLASNSAYTLSVTYTACSAAPACTPVTITTSSIAAGSTGAPYVQRFAATGGSGTYVYSLAGNLPAGLSLTGDSLSGTPTQAGTFAITVTATDPVGCPSGTASYSLVIAGNAPASVTTTAGTPQTTKPSTAFSTPLQATVRAANNATLSGVNLTFTAPTTGATGTFTGGVSTVTVVTDANGVATAPTFTANSTAGNYTVTASVNGVGSPANFSLANVCPATIVTTSADSGPGSLRDIIANACPASTITFDPTITSIVLTTGEISITKAITITGTGANVLSISGNNVSRIFNITAGTSTVNITGLTVKDGKPQAGALTSNSQNGGGGILLYTGVLNLTNCVITNNDASLTGYAEGGGLDNEGSGLVTVTGCSITNNKAQEDGGGIAQWGAARMTITNSTISGNVATGGGGTNGDGIGGGILYNGLMTLTNSTVYGNTGYLGGGNIFRNASTLTMGNTIVAGGVLSSGAGAANGIDVYGAVTSTTGYNLIQNVGGYTLSGTITGNLSGVNPNLLPLGNNGGTTPTLLPMANSPAINTGNPALTLNDQRGVARPAGGQADIGAVEANAYTFYFSKSTGSLDVPGTWGTNTDGTGAAPANFTSDNQIFTIRNNATPVVANDWTVSGIASVLAGNGTNAVAVSIAPSKVFTITGAAALLMQASSSIIFGAGSNFITGAGSVANFNGKSVTFKSDATGSASLGQILGTLSNATNVTVERYFSNKRAWRLMGIPFSSSAQTIKASLMEGAANVTSNPSPGFGTQITTFTGDSRAANFDAVKAASSLRIYTADNFNSDSLHTPNTTALITANPAYFVFVRGDRSIDRTTAGAPSSATILRSTGLVTQGTVSLGVAGSSFSLIPNIYPSAVDFDALKTIPANSSINTFYVWDPSIGTAGQYRTISISGSAAPYTYTATPGDVNNAWRYIPSSSAFFVPGSRTVSFTEATKTTGTSPVSTFRTTTSTEPQLAVNLNTVNGDNTTSLADGVRVVFDNSYSSEIDDDDAKKIEGFGFNLGINSHSEVLSVERRPLPAKGDSIFLKLWNTTPGNYQFEMKPANFSSLTSSASLYDRYLNTYSPVDLNTGKAINFSITSDAISADTNRFSIVFTSGVLPITAIDVKAYQKNAGVQVEWNITTESNMGTYDVEKSADGQNFKKAGSLAATGNNNAAAAYSWLDLNPWSGNNFYRIKAAEKTGGIKYSTVVNIKIGNEKPGIVIYPNPVIDKTINLQLINQPVGIYTIKLFNSLGQQLLTKTIEHIGGSATQTIQLNRLVSKGVYQLHISNGAGNINQQIVIQ